VSRRLRLAILVGAAVGATAAFTGLGLWQLERARAKAAIERRLEASGGPVQTALPRNADALAAVEYTRVRIRGRFLPQHQLLLDNRTVEGRPGFDVLTPLQLADGRTILVDRGWVEMDARRRPQRSIELAKTGEVTVSGRLWRPDPAIGLGPAIAPGEGWPRVITRVEYETLETVLGRELERAVIRADGDAEWIFRARSLEPAFGPDRHVGYAVQWFALALTVVVVAITLSVRRGLRGADE